MANLIAETIGKRITMKLNRPGRDLLFYQFSLGNTPQRYGRIVWQARHIRLLAAQK
jgi:hypothetical protein